MSFPVYISHLAVKIVCQKWLIWLTYSERRKARRELGLMVTYTALPNEESTVLFIGDAWREKTAREDFRLTPTRAIHMLVLEPITFVCHKLLIYNYLTDVFSWNCSQNVAEKFFDAAAAAPRHCYNRCGELPADQISISALVNTQIWVTSNFVWMCYFWTGLLNAYSATCENKCRRADTLRSYFYAKKRFSHDWQ